MRIERISTGRLIYLPEAEGPFERWEEPAEFRAKMLHLTPLCEDETNEVDRPLLHIPSDLATTFEALQTVTGRVNRLPQTQIVPEA